MLFSVCKGQWVAAAIPTFACVFLFRGIPDHWRLKARKGRDRMNKYQDAKSYLGEVNLKELNAGFHEFLALSRKIREALGVQGYLLDRYLFRKLKSVRCFSYSEIVEQGEEAGERLRKLCRQAVYGEEPEKIQYAQTVHTYIEKHPSSYAEKHTNEEMYTAELAHLYLEQAAPRFYQELEDDLLCQCNLNDGIELYNRIVQLLGEERELDRLNALFMECFLLVKPMELYIQGYIQDLIWSLTYRDMQTDHTILQILFDRQEP